MTVRTHVLKLSLLSLLLLGLSGCIAAAAGAGAEVGYLASRDDDRTTAQTVEDQLLVSKVKTKLMADSRTPGLDINVDSFKGHITLRGGLRNQAQVDEAIRIAKDTDGVKGVTSKLVVVG